MNVSAENNEPSLSIAAGEVHVWQVEIARHLADESAFFVLLDHIEQQRARRFYFAKDRSMYTIAHGVLRVLLGRYLGCHPCAAVYTIGDWGKPRLSSPSKSGGFVHFNLSHSGAFALIAFAAVAEIGVDIEVWDPGIDHQQLAEYCFSAAEQRMFADLPLAQKLAGFYACWSRKEAYIKALGFGLSRGLDSFDVELRPGYPARVLADRMNPDNCATWALYAFTPLAGYSAAVCVNDKKNALSHFTFEA